MQQENHRRLSMLSTPAQNLSILSSNPTSTSTSASASTSTSQKSNFSYSQNIVPTPAAYGYLPQPIWPQEYRPIQGGSRAMPLRMQRGTTNRAESRQIPFPSLQPSSDRPYSVPVYLKHHARSGSDGSFTHPPRPVTSLSLDSVDKSETSRLAVFPQHGVAQKAEHDLHALRVTALKEWELSKRAFKTTRPVANRGSRTTPQSNTSTVESNHEELSPSSISPEKRLVGIEEGQKRAISYIDEKPNPPKRIKFNVIQNQSQVTTALRASKQLSMGNTSDVQPAQIRKPSSIHSNTGAKEFNRPLEEFNHGTNMTRGLDTADNIINKADLLDDSRSIRTSESIRGAPNLKPINISTTNDTLRLSRASPPGLRLESQNLNIFRRQYDNTATRCGMLSGAVPSEAQVETGAVANNSYSYNPHCETVASSTTKKEGEYNNRSLDLQLSRIRDLLCAQDKDGMDTFIKMRFCSKGNSILETLANELLLGLAVRDIELLESIAK
ncbi:hypothetical protein F4811DRAFT_511645 [Daldinia bambusicola]|nr:hypothetical protein F4811DRAFT_511645 [Daldinia bambusicola]